MEVRAARGVAGGTIGTGGLHQACLPRGKIEKAMTSDIRFVVSSEESAMRALGYFNGFHDGFMKRILLRSHDEMAEDHGQSCSGTFDVEIDFAHYNYADGSEPFHPYNQIIRAEFRNARDILADFREGAPGNTIIGFSITAATRVWFGQSMPERCLALRFSRHYLLENERRYELREIQMFTFTEATFAELPCGE